MVRSQCQARYCYECANACKGLEVPCGDVAISARPEIPSAFRITMAAIDPSAEAEGEEGAPQRATLKVIRQPLDLDDYDSDEDDEFDADEFEARLADEDDDEDDSEDEGMNGGPSDPTKSKKARKEAAEAEIRKMLMEEGMDLDEDEGKPNGVAKSAKAKGKQPASDEEEDEDDDEDIDSDESDEGEVEEFVICTLDPSKVCEFFFRDSPLVLTRCPELPTAAGYHCRRRRACLVQGLWYPQHFLDR